MKLVLATVSALTLLSVGAANAATATFEGVDLGATDFTNVSFANALTPLGVTSSALAGSTGGTSGVYVNNLANFGAPVNNANTTINYGLRSFATGNGGTWTLTFGSGVASFDFAYNETETSGFTVSYFGSANNVLASNTVNPSGAASAVNMQCAFASTCASVNYSNSVGIYKVTIADTGNDNVAIDNITTSNILVGVPEPSTYMMVGSALAALAAFRRRRS